MVQLYALYDVLLFVLYYTGLSFGMEAIMALDGTLLLEEIVQAKEVPAFDPIYYRLVRS